MTEQRQIKITVKPDGSAEVEAIGFVGASCKDVTEQFAQALGQIESEHQKAEYYVHEGDYVHTKRG